MSNLNLTQQELNEIYSQVIEFSNGVINERNSDNEYSLEEKQSHEEHWKGVMIGAEVLYKHIQDTIYYKKLLVESN